jgi:CubicO group peptidase (beta-lactamase class C family)
MTRRLPQLYLILAALIFALPVEAQHFPSDAELLEIIRTRVEDDLAVGIVVGVIEADGTRRIQAYGDPGPGRMPLDAETVFEIGSITKVFTGILLASMAQDGLLSIDDPVQAYAPPGLTMPTWDDRSIRFVDIATHRSALPRMPSNMAPANPSNPYADYTVDMMYEFLSGYELPRDIGAEFEYSNLAVGLMGQILAEIAGTDYETLVKDRILDPLGMDDSGITLSPDMERHMARGHDVSGAPVSNWDIPAMAGAGALRSSMNDMLDFMEANVRAVRDPATALERAMRTSHEPHPDGGEPALGLNWIVQSTDNGTIVWHNGGTGGFRTWAGFDPERGVAAVVLTNSGHGADDIGFHLVDPGLPLAPLDLREVVDLPRETMERYIGVYELSPTFQITVTLADEGLRLQATGQSQFPIFAASETRFFLSAVEAEIEFVIEDGEVTALVLYQNGAEQRARKVG